MSWLLRRAALPILISLFLGVAFADISIPVLGPRGELPSGLTSTFSAELRRAVTLTGIDVTDADLVTQGIAGSLDPEITRLIAGLLGTRYALSGEIAAAGPGGAPFVVNLLLVDVEQDRHSDLITRTLSLATLPAVTQELALEILAFTDQSTALPGGDAGLFVSSEPGGAEVYLNNRLIGVTGDLALLELAPGRYTLEVRHDGFLPSILSLELRAGGTRFPHVVLTPIAGGGISVESVPEAEVFVAGTSFGFTPVTLSWPAGNPTVELVRDGFASVEVPVAVRNNRVSRVRQALAPLREPMVYWGAADGTQVRISGVAYPGLAAGDLRPGRVEIVITDAAGRREYSHVLPLLGVFELDLESGTLTPFSGSFER